MTYFIIHFEDGITCDANQHRLKLLLLVLETNTERSDTVRLQRTTQLHIAKLGIHFSHAKVSVLIIFRRFAR